MNDEIRPVRTPQEHANALEQIERLWGASPGTPEGDRLDIWVALVEAYEAQAFPIDFPDPVDAILFRMEQQGLSRADLEPFIGNRGRVSEILNRKRHLSLDMIRKLSAGLGIPVEVLIRPMSHAA